MFVMEILQEIVIHFSFYMIRTFASFSGHTLSVEVYTNCRLKLPNILEIWLLRATEVQYLFYLKGDYFNVNQLLVIAIN